MDTRGTPNRQRMDAADLEGSNHGVHLRESDTRAAVSGGTERYQSRNPVLGRSRDHHHDNDFEFHHHHGDDDSILVHDHDYDEYNTNDDNEAPWHDHSASYHRTAFVPARDINYGPADHDH